MLPIATPQTKAPLLGDCEAPMAAFELENPENEEEDSENEEEEDLENAGDPFTQIERTTTTPKKTMLPKMTLPKLSLKATFGKLLSKMTQPKLSIRATFGKQHNIVIPPKELQKAHSPSIWAYFTIYHACFLISLCLNVSFIVLTSTDDKPG
jgi:hypothetical protein